MALWPQAGGGTASPPSAEDQGSAQAKAGNEQLPRHSCSEGEMAMKTLRMELCNLDREVSVSPSWAVTHWVCSSASKEDVLQ